MGRAREQLPLVTRSGLEQAAEVLANLADDQAATRAHELRGRAIHAGDEVDRQFEAQIEALRTGAAACRILLDNWPHGSADGGADVDGGS